MRESWGCSLQVVLLLSIVVAVSTATTSEAADLPHGEGELSATLNEGIRLAAPEACNNALSVFGPYDPPLYMYGVIDASPPAAVLAVLDSYDVVSESVDVDGTGNMPKSASSVVFSQSLPFGTRLLSASVTYPITETDSAASSVGGSIWHIDIGYVNGGVMTTYEASSSATMDLTYGGSATGIRLSYTGFTYSSILGVTFQDTQGQQASYTGFIVVWDESESLDISFADLDDYADLTSIRKIVVNVVGTDLSLDIEELSVIGTSDVPVFVPSICNGVGLSSGTLWYKIFPSQSYVTVSTCNQYSSIATNVGVYSGNCQDMTCMETINRLTCYNGQAVLFYQSDSAPLYVSVSGRDGAEGAFELFIAESWDFNPLYDDDDDYVPLTDSWPVWTTWTPLTSLDDDDFFWYFGSFSDDDYFGSFGSFGSFHGFSYRSSPLFETLNYSWEPPADDGPGSACSQPISVTYGQSDVFTNTGIVYNNLCGLYSHSGSRWFVFSPTHSDSVKIDVCTSNFDTVLAVVDGCDSLSCIASNDDRCGNNASYVVFNVSAGRDYLIMVGGYSSSSGSFRLTISSY